MSFHSFMRDYHLIFFYFFPIDVLIKNIKKKIDPISHKGRKKIFLTMGSTFAYDFKDLRLDKCF